MPAHLVASASGHRPAGLRTHSLRGCTVRPLLPVIALLVYSSFYLVRDVQDYTGKVCYDALSLDHLESLKDRVVSLFIAVQ